ncbi:hypothetical protein F-VV10_0178 [Faustovirus]|nr:hypothetical protein F-VV10_0178 [Faustovirus]
MIKISEVNYVDGKRQGECRKFWTDGTIRATINYTDDLKDGVYEYRSGDSIFERKTYKKGKLNGVKISYTDNRIFEVMNYVNGKLHGAYVKYGDSIVFVNEYVDGVKHGDSYQYDVVSGNVIYHCYYVDGMREGTANMWFNNGVLCFTCEYVNDRPIDGEIMIYDEYGNLSITYRNFNGYKLHVYTRCYSRYGTLTQIGHRAALSNTTNNYMKFYESGNINEKLFIVNGKKVIYSFHENGEFMDKQTLKDI